MNFPEQLHLEKLSRFSLSEKPSKIYPAAQGLNRTYLPRKALSPAPSNETSKLSFSSQNIFYRLHQKMSQNESKSPANVNKSCLDIENCYLF
jgi:hypothetical protein